MIEGWPQDIREQERLDEATMELQSAMEDRGDFDELEDDDDAEG